jgi:hypothetical protein
MFISSLRAAGFAIVLCVGSAFTVNAMPGVGIGGSGIMIGGGLPGAGVGIPSISPFLALSQRFRDLTVVGQVGIDESKLPPNAVIVHLRLDGRDIPMRLDTELHSAELQFDPQADYGRELYHSILTKRVEVVGEQALRDQVSAAAQQSSALQIEGYVFHRSSPYLVLKSVRRQ